MTTPLATVPAARKVRRSRSAGISCCHPAPLVTPVGPPRCFGVIAFSRLPPAARVRRRWRRASSTGCLREGARSYAKRMPTPRCGPRAPVQEARTFRPCWRNSPWGPTLAVERHRADPDFTAQRGHRRVAVGHRSLDQAHLGPSTARTSCHPRARGLAQPLSPARVRSRSSSRSNSASGAKMPARRGGRASPPTDAPPCVASAGRGPCVGPPPTARRSTESAGARTCSSRSQARARASSEAVRSSRSASSSRNRASRSPAAVSNVPRRRY